MTITVSTNQVTWLGNGATSVFPYSFAMPTLADASLLLTSATGTQSVVAPGAYSITGVGQPTAGGGPQGGSVTYPLTGSPIAAGTSLTLTRTVPAIQPNVFTNQAGLWPSVVEGSDDNIVMQMQQAQNAVSRAIVVNPVDPAPLPLPPVSVRALQSAIFDANGNLTPGLPSGSAAVSAVMQPVVAAATLALAAAAMGVLPLTGGTITGPVSHTALLTASAGVTLSGSVLTLSGSTVAATNAGTFTNTQMNLGHTYVTNGLSPQSGYQMSHAGDFATLGAVYTMAVPSTSTVYEADGLASYVTNASTTTGVAAASFYAYNVAAGATSWAQNILVSDQGFASTVMACEIDVGASNTASAAYGFNLVGVFPTGTPATAVPFQVSVLNHPWQWAFVSFDGAANQFALIGAAGAVANSDGQPIQFNVRDNTNTVRTCGIQAIHSSAGASLVLDAPTGTVQVSGLEAVSGTATFSDAIIVAQAGGVLASLMNGATQIGSISWNGTLVAYNTTSDRRLKDIDGLSDGSLIDRLKVYTASFKADPTGTKRSMLLADEAQLEAPWSVTGQPGAVHQSDVVLRSGRVIHKAGDIDPQMVDHSIYVPDLIAKCHSLQAQVSKIPGLVAQCEALQAEVAKLVAIVGGLSSAMLTPKAAG